MQKAIEHKHCLGSQCYHLNDIIPLPTGLGDMSDEEISWLYSGHTHLEYLQKLSLVTAGHTSLLSLHPSNLILMQKLNE